mmetsp:Transcript_89524/g.252228  ORF Transcript_89524/g.252228 Transcript_89524/m.252228 type:complete len:261 (+) Transcript_89524:1085-1867(+)
MRETNEEAQLKTEVASQQDRAQQGPYDGRDDGVLQPQCLCEQEDGRTHQPDQEQRGEKPQPRSVELEVTVGEPEEPMWEIEWHALCSQRHVLRVIAVSVLQPLPERNEQHVRDHERRPETDESLVDGFTHPPRASERLGPPGNVEEHRHANHQTETLVNVHARLENLHTLSHCCGLDAGRSVCIHRQHFLVVAMLLVPQPDPPQRLHAMVHHHEVNGDDAEPVQVVDSARSSERLDWGTLLELLREQTRKGRSVKRHSHR